MMQSPSRAVRWKILLLPLLLCVELIAYAAVFQEVMSAFVRLRTGGLSNIQRIEQSFDPIQLVLGICFHGLVGLLCCHVLRDRRRHPLTIGILALIGQAADTMVRTGTLRVGYFAVCLVGLYGMTYSLFSAPSVVVSIIGAYILSWASVWHGFVESRVVEQRGFDVIPVSEAGSARNNSKGTRSLNDSEDGQ